MPTNNSFTSCTNQRKLRSWGFRLHRSLWRPPGKEWSSGCWGKRLNHSGPFGKLQRLWICEDTWRHTWNHWSTAFRSRRCKDQAWSHRRSAKQLQMCRCSLGPLQLRSLLLVWVAEPPFSSSFQFLPLSQRPPHLRRLPLLQQVPLQLLAPPPLLCQWTLQNKQRNLLGIDKCSA